ncbi:MAG: hypothetical protein WD595_05455 [Waddliaceae bacterium]
MSFSLSEGSAYPNLSAPVHQARVVQTHHLGISDFASLEKVQSFCSHPSVKKVRHIAIPVILFVGAVSISSLARNGLTFLVSVIPGLIAGSFKEKSLVINFHQNGISVNYQQVFKKVQLEKEGQQSAPGLDAGKALTLLQKAKKMWNDPRVENIKKIIIPILAIVAAVAVGVSIASFSLGILAGAATGFMISSMVNHTFQVSTTEDGFKIIM